MPDYRGTTNKQDTAIILAMLQHEREQEFRRIYGGIGTLYRSETSCTGFMNSNPNHQIRYAEEHGMFDNGSLPE